MTTIINNCFSWQGKYIHYPSEDLLAFHFKCVPSLKLLNETSMLFKDGKVIEKVAKAYCDKIMTYDSVKDCIFIVIEEEVKKIKNAPTSNYQTNTSNNYQKSFGVPSQMMI